MQVGPDPHPRAGLTEGEAVKLRVERKHITDLLKMVASQAECDLVRLVAPHDRRAEDEGCTLIQSALASAGDIMPNGDDLTVALEPLSSPHRTHALTALCEKLNDTGTRFPGSKLRLQYEMKPPPEGTLDSGVETEHPEERPDAGALPRFSSRPPPPSISRWESSFP